MYMTAAADGQLYTTDVSALFTTGQTYLAKIQTRNGIFTQLDRIQVQPGFGTQAHPCIAPDKRYLLFDVDGGTHLYVSFRKNDGTWNTAIDLAEHGLDRNAGGAYISPDGKYLFFHLNGDIWWVDIRVIENLNPFTGGTAANATTGFELYQNNPNPCREQTTIAFSLDKAGPISLDLFNQTGLKVTSLLTNQTLLPGKHEYRFLPAGLTPGIYTYTLSGCSGAPLSRQMLLVGQ